MANGPGVAQGKTIEAHIVDIAPTLLASLGLRVPQDMEGKVLTELFETAPTVEFEPPEEMEISEAEEVYTDAEKEALTKRLADLGYLE